MRAAAYLSATAFAVACLQSCLEENDMAYPHVYAEVISFAVEGQDAVSIDTESRTISVEVSETAELSHLKVTDFTFTDAAVCDGLHTGDVLDLTSPLKIVLRTYQEYEWTITATQPIDRYVKCQGQVGDAVINLNDRSVYLKISDEYDMRELEFTDIKLEREGSVITSYEKEKDTMVPFEGFPIVMNCLNWVDVEVEYKGEKVIWQIQVEEINVDLMMMPVDNPWATFAEVSAMYDGTGAPYFRYRVAGSESWTDVTDVYTEEMEVSAVLKGLTPGTEYEVEVVNGDLVSSAVPFSTEPALQVENSDFDDWYQDGEAWYPNADANNFWWDTANGGTKIMHIFPTQPTDDIAVSSGKAAVLKTEFVNLSIISKLAAGNIYTGRFGKISGLGAILDWGIPFTSRPLALKGYYKYQPVTINQAQEPYLDKKGTIDLCQIQIFLTDWSEPFEVNTNEGKFVDVEKDEHIIAYGKLETSESSDEYKSFIVSLEYRDLSRKPKYIVISACASRYGDYFTGGVGSTLYVDEFELVYDGDVVKAPGVE